MEAPEPSPEVRAMLERLRALGVEAETTPGGRAAQGRLPVSETPFPGPDAPRPVKEIRFATVGASRIKCLEPGWLFHLPLIPIADCTEAQQLEMRVRETWQRHLDQQRRARSSLERIGIEPELEEGGAVLAFPLGLSDLAARARCVAPGRFVLPARGPLSGHPLATPEARVFTPETTPESALDLQMTLTTRLEQLAREAQQQEQASRAKQARLAGAPPTRVTRREHRVLLVGPRLSPHRALAESLRVRGYEVTTANNDAEAMESFCRQSFELMLVDAQLGRCDGLELVPAIQTLAGIERLPIVLVDERNRAAVRQRAKEIGAVGYLVHPVDAARVAPGLARLLQAPVYRRYSRYPVKLAVCSGALGSEGYTTAIGRLGMFVCSPLESRLHALEDHEVQLSEIGATLRVKGETVYRRRALGTIPSGMGIRFHHFRDEDEALLIRYLRVLEGA